MKVWQLASIARDNQRLLRTTAEKRKEWTPYATWYSDFGELVRTQDRSVLDADLPGEYVAEVLANMDGTLYVSADGWLRSWLLSPTDTPMSFLEAFRRYGDVVEEALERGAIALHVDQHLF